MITNCKHHGCFLRFVLISAVWARLPAGIVRGSEDVRPGLVLSLSAVRLNSKNPSWSLEQTSQLSKKRISPQRH